MDFMHALVRLSLSFWGWADTTDMPVERGWIIFVITTVYLVNPEAGDMGRAKIVFYVLKPSFVWRGMDI
jgi:hypothetical protein